MAFLNELIIEDAFIFYYQEFIYVSQYDRAEQHLVTSKCMYPRDEKKELQNKKKQRLSHIRGVVTIVVEKMRSHRESISLIKGETGTGTPVAKADTRARIQRQRKFMPVPCRQRQAYDVPSTVSRGSYPPISPSLCLLIRPSILFARRSSADHSSPSLCLRMESRFLRVTQLTVGRPRALARVDYFSKSSGSRIFK